MSGAEKDENPENCHTKRLKIDEKSSNSEDLKSLLS